MEKSINEHNFYRMNLRKTIQFSQNNNKLSRK